VETAGRLSLPLFIVLFAASGPNAQAIVRALAETFGALYEEHLPRVYKFINYRVADKETAEDITLVVFEKALSKFQTYDSEKAAFSTWILTIARNTLIDHYRSRGKEKAIQRETKFQVMVFSDSPEEDAAKAEEQRKLRGCLVRLNEREREIISFKFGSEITNREIARITGLSESNVGAILCRAIHRLREDFAGWHDE
jgi:RNA polymerase sigma factor (sigma-70 family)